MEISIKRLKRRTRLMALLQVALALAATNVNGQVELGQILSESAAAGEAVALGDIYMHHFFQRDMEALEGFWTEESVVGDLTGVDTLMVAIPSLWAGITVESVEVIGRFGGLGGEVTYYGEARGKMEFDELLMRFRVPYATILVFSEGKIVTHDSQFHLSCLNRQAFLQLEEPLSYEMLPRCMT